MGNSLERIQQQEVEDEQLPATQQKVEEQIEEEENDGDEEEQQVEEFLKPQLAFEIYAALPIAHQRRLLDVWRSIYEDEPIPDEWTRWKVYQWAGNHWHLNYCGQNVQLSVDGLNVARKGADTFGFVRAIHGVEFPPTRMACPQVCFFETKHIKGHFWFGFCTGGNERFYGLLVTGLYTDGAVSQLLPGVRIENSGIATIGCGLIKHLGKRKIFFTKNGQLLAKPIPLPLTAPAELFPFISLHSRDAHFEDTNFGLRPFQFKYKGNEEKLLEEMVLE